MARGELRRRLRRRRRRWRTTSSRANLDEQEEGTKKKKRKRHTHTHTRTHTRRSCREFWMSQRLCRPPRRCTNYEWTSEWIQPAPTTINPPRHPLIRTPFPFVDRFIPLRPYFAGSFIPLYWKPFVPRPCTIVHGPPLMTYARALHLVTPRQTMFPWFLCSSSQLSRTSWSQRD